MSKGYKKGRREVDRCCMRYVCMNVCECVRGSGRDREGAPRRRIKTYKKNRTRTHVKKQ